jgi:hypothetical protein
MPASETSTSRTMRIGTGEMAEDIDRDAEYKGHGYYDGDVNLPAFITTKNLKFFAPSELYVTSS